METNHVQVFMMYLQSQQTAQTFLYNSYEKRNIEDAAKKSYENCSAFMHYLNHGEQFFHNGKKLDFVLQPVLFFYGMVHMIKANLLAVRPNYPESTAILAHGVSARKRKKKDYSFLQDEVKLQYKGLFPYFSEHLFSVKQIPIEKLKMRDLLVLIPEMASLLTHNEDHTMMWVGEAGDNKLQFPLSILDDYHLTEKAFIQRISNYLPPIEKTKKDSTTINVHLKTSLNRINGPFYTDCSLKKIYFPSSRDYFLPFPEIMVHYLLLYNLSMICRYESHWWGDLLAHRPDMDYPAITCYLKIAADKIPVLLGHELLKRAPS